MKLNKKVFNYFLIILGVILGILATFSIYSHVRYGRSATATLAESILGQNEKETYDVTKAKLESKIGHEEEYTIPDSIEFSCTLSQKKVGDRNVYYMNYDQASDYTIFYVHGGAYVEEPIPNHWQFLDTLVQKTGCQIIMPDYPLAPNHVYSEAYEFLENLYRDYVTANPDKKMILMGDSAGGGLSLGLAEDFKSIGIKDPDEIILMSPWVDVTLSNPEIEQYESDDPLLSRAVRACGEYWAGDTPLTDWKVSPLYGDLSDIKNVTLFVGTREILYPDDIKLFEYLKDDPSNELHIGKGMNHVYPLYPIPEGRDATKIICDKIVD